MRLYIQVVRMFFDLMTIWPNHRTATTPAMTTLFKNQIEAAGSLTRRR